MFDFNFYNQLLYYLKFFTDSEIYYRTRTKILTQRNGKNHKEMYKLIQEEKIMFNTNIINGIDEYIHIWFDCFSF